MIHVDDRVSRFAFGQSLLENPDNISRILVLLRSSIKLNEKLQQQGVTSAL